jgi:hypothetical protein
MTNAPSEVDQKQLDELNLRTQKHLHQLEEQTEDRREETGDRKQNTENRKQ